MTTHPTLEQRAREIAEEIFKAISANFHKSREPVDYIAEILKRHLTNYAQEAANAAAEAMREACLDIKHNVQDARDAVMMIDIARGIRDLAPDSAAWLQCHDAAVRLEAINWCGTHSQREQWDEIKRLESQTKEQHG